MRNSLLRWFSLSSNKTGCNYYPTGRRLISTSSTTLPSSSRVNSPWLMLLRESYSDPTTKYKFFSFSENKTISIPMSPDGPCGDDYNYVGSSQGWLAWVNTPNNNHRIFLTNPVSGQQIQLPLIIPLLKKCSRSIQSIILSSSPDSNNSSNSIALMSTFGDINPRRLAFCRPGHDSEWIPLHENYGANQTAYSSKDQLFYCFDHYAGSLAAWDLRDSSEPKRTHFIEQVLRFDKKKYGLAEDAKAMRIYLVIEPSSGDVLLVQRYFICNVRFLVFRYDSDEKAMKYLSDSLPDDCVLFVGYEHGFALKASDFPEFVPKSIYFDDIGGRGIYNYRDRSISPFGSLLESSHIWLTPNPC